MPIPWPAVGACVLPNIGGWAGNICVHNQRASWYKELKKPVWTPPGYAFGPIWTALYSSMGYASYLVWRDGGGFNGDAALPLAVYGGQLALNWAWTPIFFGKKSIKWGLVDIIALGVSAGACAVLFERINSKAGLLMLPYLGWLGIATSLNFYIYQNNEAEDKKQ